MGPNLATLPKCTFTYTTILSRFYKKTKYVCSTVVEFNGVPTLAILVIHILQYDGYLGGSICCLRDTPSVSLPQYLTLLIFDDDVS